MTTMTPETETTEDIFPESIPCQVERTEPFTKNERLLAFLMLLQALVQGGLDLRVAAEFLPVTGEQNRQIKDKLAEFLKAFPDKKPHPGTP